MENESLKVYTTGILNDIPWRTKAPIQTSIKSVQLFDGKPMIALTKLSCDLDCFLHLEEGEEKAPVI